MTTVIPVTIPLAAPSDRHSPPDEAELAAAAFLSPYQGRALDAYRYDLRAFFQWAADQRRGVLKAARSEIELYVRAMEGRGLAPSTIDRRLSTVCGFYRFAHIDGRIPPTRRSTSDGRRSIPPTRGASTARSSAPSSLQLNGSTRLTPPWRCSSGSTACE